MAERVFFEHGGLALAYDFAGDAPVDRNDVAGFDLFDVVFGLEPTRQFLFGRRAEDQFTLREEEWFGDDGDCRARSLYDRAPAHAAFIHGFERVFDLKVPRALPDVEDVERMMRNGTLADFLCDEVERLRADSIFDPLAFEEMAIERAGIDLVKQLVAEPIGLDNAFVKWVLDVVRVCDVAQIWEHGLEFAEQLLEAGVARAFIDVGADFTVCVRAAVMEAIWAECVPATAKHAVHKRGFRV